MSNPTVIAVDQEYREVARAEWSEKDRQYHFHKIAMINEAVTQVPISTQDSDRATDPPRFTDDLVTGKYYDRNDPHHLMMVALGDPVANALTFGIAEDVFSDGWRYVKEYGDEDEVDGAEAIHADFDQCHAKYWLQLAWAYSRAQGDCLLYTGPKQFRVDIVNAPDTNRALDVFSKEFFKLPDEHKDDMGRPTKVRIWPDPSKGKGDANSKLIRYEEFIHFINIPKGREYAGLSSLYAVWSPMTLIRHVSYNIGWAYQKFGMGAIVVFLAGRLTADTEKSLETAMKNIGQQRAGVLDANLIDRIEYIGPEGSLANNAPEIIDTFLGQVAVGSRFPKVMLTGDSTGQISAGEVQDKSYAASLSREQEKAAKYIKELARRRGHNTDWVVEFNARYAKDEYQEAVIDELRARAESYRNKSELNINTRFSDQSQNNNPAGGG